MIRPTAVAGTWYPGSAGALTREVDAYLSAAAEGPAGRVQAIVAPHAGLMFSGPGRRLRLQGGGRRRLRRRRAGRARRTSSGSRASRSGPTARSTRRSGRRSIDEAGARALAASPVVQALPAAHAREHSLEMQLPFLRRRAAGRADRAAAHRVSAPRRRSRRSRRRWRSAFRRPPRAARRQHRSVALLRRRDAPRRSTRASQRASRRSIPTRCSTLFEQYPEPSAGGTSRAAAAPAIAVMMAARALGARDGRVAEVRALRRGVRRQRRCRRLPGGRVRERSRCSLTRRSRRSSISRGDRVVGAGRPAHARRRMPRVDGACRRRRVSS